MIQFEARPGILDLSWGHPRPELLPTAEWGVAQAGALRASGWRALTYGYAAGPHPLTDWLAARLARIEGGTPQPESLFVTAGASHALALLASLLVEPGDVVLVDEPTYHLAFQIIADARAELRSVPAGDPAAVAAKVRAIRAEGRRVAFLYLVPTFANPTGRSLEPAARRALVEIEGLTVVEDDTYRELVYEGSAPPSLWHLAGGRNVIRIGSFAKTVAPGLRLGWISGTPGLVNRLASLGYVHSGGGVNHTTAVTMAEFGTSGAYDTHLARLRDAYRAQRDALVGALSPYTSIMRPAGGWFLWVTMPPGRSAVDLLPVAERQGVSFVPGPSFHLRGDGGHDRLRLSFSLLPPDDLAEAAARLIVALG
ncbi:DNA-binding transcriptional MocR family regulator [Actinoplanes tereljensis]|uniref:Aminotransferase class I/II n=1 Tax=Paractinoplanes tereljensis TaxID=571912 RepID=A0A919TS68_9ACTN|nr:PLP-dependent aminotransferase family protein [Actinoplanes tereljensis]GIF20226.1 aminotransferase class I/II [Actinoplanes tereljensis]